jgi:hypothetical protein
MKKIIVHENFLPNDLFNKCFHFSKYTYDNEFDTLILSKNLWNQSVIKDSNMILIKKLDNNELFVEIINFLEKKLCSN